MYQFLTDIKKEAYEEYVMSSSQLTLLQSYPWSIVKDNWDHMYTGVYDDGKLVATALVLIRRLPLNKCFFYIPHGPIMNYKNQKLVSFYFQELKKLARLKKAVFIRFDPAIIVNSYRCENYNTDRKPDTGFIIDSLERVGAKHKGFNLLIHEATQPRFQSVVYNTDNYQDQLPKHTKRFIRYALRFGIKVECGGLELLDDFSKLMEMTTQRRHLGLRDRSYYLKLLNAYKEDCRIFLAYIDLDQELACIKKKLADLSLDLEEAKEKASKKIKIYEQQYDSTRADLTLLEDLRKDLNDQKGRIPIAGTLSICYGPISEMPYVGMDIRFKKFRPQYLCYAENLEWAFK